MFDEESRLDPTKDDIDFIEGFIGFTLSKYIYIYKIKMILYDFL